MSQGASFTKKFLEEQKKCLLEHKQRILNGLRSLEDFKMSSDDLPEDGDLSQAILNQNYAISLRERELSRLKEIDGALSRIEDGNYGYCEESGEPIGEPRLRKLPWTTLSIEAAEEIEREKKRFGRYA